MRDSLLLVGVGLFNLALSLTPCLRNTLICILLGLILGALLIFPRTYDIIKGRAHRIRWLGLHHVYASHTDTGVVIIHVLLQPILHSSSHLFTACRQNLIHKIATDFMPYRGFRSIVQAAFRILNGDDIIHRILDDVLNRHIYIDDIFISSQHGAIFIGFGIQLGHIDQINLIHDRRIPVQTRCHCRIQHFTKTQHDATFSFIDHVETHETPDDRCDRHQPNQQARRHVTGRLTSAAAT